MITAEGRIRRRTKLGCADLAGVLNLGRYADQTPAGVYYSKVGPFLPERADDPSLMVGNLLERPLLDYASLRLGGVEIERDIYVVSQGYDGGILAANLDGLVKGTRQGVEAKYDGEGAEWGEEGSDEVPDAVVVQCQGQCYVADLELVWVPALIIGYRAEFRLYCVRRDDELIDTIVPKAVAWWRRHVEQRVPPGDAPPPLEGLKALAREPASTVDLDEAALDTWALHEAAKVAFERAKANCDNRKTAVLQLLGTAEAGRLPNGDLVTFYEQNSAPRTDMPLLRAKYPSAHKECVSQGKHRVLRLVTAEAQAKRSNSKRRKGGL